MDSEFAREKLLNAIAFFVTKTRHCYKTKLFKLLYFLDFGIYRETGRPVTGLEYFAWKMGPVPRALYTEMDKPKPDFLKLLRLHHQSVTDPDFSGYQLEIKAKRDFDASCFTRRELAMMERIAEIFRDARAKDMSEVSHLAGQPWHQVFKVEKRDGGQIPYRLALDGKPDCITGEMAELIEEELRERRNLLR